MVDRTKKLTELPATTTISNNDIFIVVGNTSGNAITRKITINNFRSALPPVVVGIANTTSTGVVGIGNNITVNATGFVSVRVANTSCTGVVAVGAGLAVNATGFLSIGSNVTVNDRLSVTGETYLTGNVYLGIQAEDNASELIHFYGTIYSNVIPHTANNYQLGNTTHSWRSLHTAAVYVSNLTISNSDVRSANSGYVNIFGSDFAQLQWSDVANTSAVNGSGNTTWIFAQDAFAGMEVVQGGVAKASLYVDVGYVRLVVNSTPLTFKGTAGIPANSTSAGAAGDIAFDSNYMYYCVATNTWKRAALTTWS